MTAIVKLLGNRFFTKSAVQRPTKPPPIIAMSTSPGTYWLGASSRHFTGRYSPTKGSVGSGPENPVPVWCSRVHDTLQHVDLNSFCLNKAWNLRRWRMLEAQMSTAVSNENFYRRNASHSLQQSANTAKVCRSTVYRKQVLRNFSPFYAEWVWR